MLKEFMKAMTVTAAMIAFALCLCACGGAKDRDTIDLDAMKEKLKKQQSVEESTEKKNEPEKASEEPAEAEGFFKKAFSDDDVENNKGAFVRVANRVYFRVYDHRALELTTLGGPNIDEVNANAASELKYYDLDTDETVDVCKVCGVGPLYATADGICIMSYPDGFPSTTLVDEEGNINEHYLEGQITGVSDDGQSVVTGVSDENDRIVPTVFRGGRKIGEAKEDTDEIWCDDIGFSGDDLIVKMAAYEADGVSIYSFDKMGRLTHLGDIDPMDMQTYELSPNVEDMTATDDGGFITVTYRDGTANAIVGWAVYEFTCGVENSIEKYDSGEDIKMFDYSYPKVVIDKKGRPKLEAHKNGEVFLSEGYYGDLICITPEGEEVTIRTAYIDDPGEDPQYVSAIAAGVCFKDDSVFLLDLTGDRCPEEDVGWRQAFNLGGVYYTYFRFDEDHIRDGGWPTSGSVAGVASVGWNKGDIEYDRLVGQWEAYSTNVEGEIRMAEEEGGDREMISFDKNGDAVMSFRNTKTGKVSNERKLHRGEPDEYMEGTDYAYVFYSEDEDPLRGGICYLSHNMLKMFYLYHFDGNSTGWYEIVYRKVQD